MSCVVRGMSCVVCGTSSVVCGTSCVVCGASCVVCGTSSVVRDMSCVVCGTSCVVCGMSCVVCGTLHKKSRLRQAAFLSIVRDVREIKLLYKCNNFILLYMLTLFCANDYEFAVGGGFDLFLAIECLNKTYCLSGLYGCSNNRRH